SRRRNGSHALSPAESPRAWEAELIRDTGIATRCVCQAALTWHPGSYPRLFNVGHSSTWTPCRAPATRRTPRRSPTSRTETLHNLTHDDVRRGAARLVVAGPP